MTATPPTTARRTLRRRILGVLGAAAVLSSLLAGPQAVAAERNPVIFVHGLMGSASNWNDMIADFKRDGYRDDQLYAWEYDYTKSNKITAQHLAVVVDDVLARTGASKVDLVGHSNGGMNSRWYLKFVGGTTKADEYVSLGSPQHGTNGAYACGWTTCFELRPGSEFLTTLNDGDETPGAVRYGSWWSPCDEAMDPKRTPILSGATNTETACIAHAALLTDDTTSAQVRAFVA